VTDVIVGSGALLGFFSFRGIEVRFDTAKTTALLFNPSFVQLTYSPTGCISEAWPLVFFTPAPSLRPAANALPEDLHAPVQCSSPECPPHLCRRARLPCTFE
jgi:hypothetical protein